MINFAEKINEKHKGTQRKYDCVFLTIQIIKKNGAVSFTVNIP